MELTRREMDTLPAGAQVEDQEGDTWTKNDAGLWDLNTSDAFYHGRTAENIWGSFGPFRGLAASRSEPEPEPEIVVEGVWIVWSSSTKETINGVFPADAEINALRMVNRDGYGHAEFQPFGEVSY